jgi:hypothetical protein
LRREPGDASLRASTRRRELRAPRPEERAEDDLRPVVRAWWALLVGWAVVNTEILAVRAFDPYPYVFLNLILSMLAAIQAPVIMMSQNRQAAKDRLAAGHDYEVTSRWSSRS